MTLGTIDFKPGKDDLVRIISDRYTSIPKGTIAPLVSVSDDCYFIEGYADPVTDVSDLEILSYKRQREKSSKKQPSPFPAR